MIRLTEEQLRVLRSMHEWNLKHPEWKHGFLIGEDEPRAKMCRRTLIPLGLVEVRDSGWSHSHRYFVTDAGRKLL